MILTNHDYIVGPWACTRLGCVYTKQTMRCIGVERNALIVAGIVYDRYDGANIYMHVVSEAKNWLSRELLNLAFYYPFKTLKVNRITLTIESKNEKSIRFAKHLGFVEEGRMVEAAHDDDVLIFRMLKTECRWL